VDPDSVAEEAWNDPVRGVVTWRTLLSGDRTPTEGLTMGIAEVSEHVGAPVRLHRHAQGEAYYILSGRGVLHIDGAEHPLEPGTTAFIPGGLWHAARGVGPEPLRLLYVFAADSFSEIVYEFPAESPAADGGHGRLSTSADSPSA
jgi:mannose-6-phosphate isomerase-like protein (cupin superfamily)